MIFESEPKKLSEIRALQFELAKLEYQNDAYKKRRKEILAEIKMLEKDIEKNN